VSPRVGKHRDSDDVTARSLGQTSYTLKDMEAKVLYTDQTKIYTLKTTFNKLEVAS
jgi:hypothetical protein